MKSKYTFLGSGAQMYLGLGVRPVALTVRNLTTGLSVLDWNVGMLANPATSGGVYVATTGGPLPQTIAQGVTLYAGGDIITTASASYVVPYGITTLLGATMQGACTTFTMGSLAAATGNFDGAMASGAGAGSKIVIFWRDQAGRQQTWVDRITALSASGLSANQVTLSVGCPLATGKVAYVAFIGPAYDLVQAPAGMVMPAGVSLINTTYLTSAVMYEIEIEG